MSKPYSGGWQHGKGLCDTLEQMDALVAQGGYLYFDMRNWDKILRERKRFYSREQRAK